MNRQERRAAKRARESTTRHQLVIGNDRAMLEALDVHCPDCNSEVTKWTDRFGRLHRNVEHDSTCPVWRSMQ